MASTTGPNAASGSTGINYGVSMSTHDEDCGCTEYNELSRRQFIADTAGASGLGMFAAVFPSWLPKVVLAESYDSTRDVIISIFLRGGADGLRIYLKF